MVHFLRNDKFGQEMKMSSKCPTSAIASREVCKGMLTEITVKCSLVMKRRKKKTASNLDGDPGLPV